MALTAVSGRDPRFDGKFIIAADVDRRLLPADLCPGRRRPSPRTSATTLTPGGGGGVPGAARARQRLPARGRRRARPPGSGDSAVGEAWRCLPRSTTAASTTASVDALAATVGVGSRRRHRLFIQHVGASPIVVAQTRRVQFAVTSRSTRPTSP